jgi:Neprosin
MANENQPGSAVGILPLDAHLATTAATQFDLVRLDPSATVRDTSEFEAIKAHIADMYAGVEAVHSFEGPGGTVFDCIPVEQQPALREQSGPIPNPPDLTGVLRGGEPEPRPVRVQPQPHNVRHDRHGNAAWAPPGTIPFPRLTLEDLCRFETLDAFFHKYPASAATATGAPAVLDQPRPEVNRQEHRYANVEQAVPNIGGHSALTLYSPNVISNQYFSLSQHWYTGGLGSELQTVEVGWQVFPQLYKHSLPVLFIYWSINEYGSGAYNLTDKSFVAVKSGEALIGNALSPVSIVGGTQMEVELTVYLHEGNWWIYCGGVEPANALGYYPTSLFTGGQMATNATAIAYGGETCSRTESWPEMGSGEFAGAGWEKAAYQRAIYYFPSGGGSQWADALEPNAPDPGDYTLGPLPWPDRTTAAVPWGQYFFYGGPGEQSLE